MTLENKRTTLLYYINLCLSFQIHWWIETEVTVRKRSIRVKIGDFLSCVTLKFHGWPWKPIGHFCYTTLSFVHHSKSIGVTVRKRSIWVKIGNFLSRVTLKFDGWPRKTIGHLFYVALSFVHHFTAISELKLELESGNAQFWSKSTIFFSRVTLKFNGWPSKTIGLLFSATLCIKLYVSFRTHWWIQIWVTVRKRSIRVKIDDFFSRVT